MTQFRKNQMFIIREGGANGKDSYIDVLEAPRDGTRVRWSETIPPVPKKLPEARAHCPFCNAELRPGVLRLRTRAAAPAEMVIRETAPKDFQWYLSEKGAVRFGRQIWDADKILDLNKRRIEILKWKYRYFSKLQRKYAKTKF